MKVCLVTREIEGIAGAGGMKDVVRGIADALVARGDTVTVFLPGYGIGISGEPLYEIDVPLWGEQHRIRVFSRDLDGIRIRLLDSPYFSSKLGVYTYTRDDCPDTSEIGKGHHDVREINTLLQAGTVIGLALEGITQDIIHGHDGHAGLLPLFLKKYPGRDGFFEKTGVLVTVHNAGTAYQQIMGDVEETSRLTGLAPEILQTVTVDDMVNPLLAAGLYGHVNTVSPGYASELIDDSDRYSGNLGKSYRTHNIRLKGIYNGINPDYWLNMSGKGKGNNRDEKSTLRQMFLQDLQAGTFGFSGVELIGALPGADVPWIVFHGRLTGQKGLKEILKLDFSNQKDEAGCHIIIYGQGEIDYENQLTERAARDKQWTFIRGYAAEFTARLIRASSLLLVPSEWEPCGQIDMVGQLLGTLPVVRAVGGLKKIRNKVDGFAFPAGGCENLQQCIDLALDWERNRKKRVSRMLRCAEKVIYGRRTWRKILVRGYLPLYRKAKRSVRHLKRTD